MVNLERKNCQNQAKNQEIKTEFCVLQWFNFAPKSLALSDLLALNGFAVTVQPVAVQV